jgi:hypothetical protein
LNTPNISSQLPIQYYFQEFPRIEAAVYILYVHTPEGQSKLIPFYVGQTDNFHQRMRDYMNPQLAASTDFKVGQAINYFKAKGLLIQVAVRKDIIDQNQRRREEADRSKAFRHIGYALLNDLKGYNYKTANRHEEITKVHQFCDSIIDRLNGGLHD